MVAIILMATDFVTIYFYRKLSVCIQAACRESLRVDHISGWHDGCSSERMLRI